MRLKNCAVLLAASALMSSGASFTNGNFETGNATGWTVGGGYRGNELNPAITTTQFLPGGTLYDPAVASGHSGIVTPGGVAQTGGLLNQVYSGNYSWRVEDTSIGGYASVITQTVTNYTDANIFFAWAAVLEGAHGATDAATVIINLRDVTTGVDLITRQYNAGTTGSGVDARFNYNASTNFYWTPWQIEQLALPLANIGDTFTLSILAADCQPTGHEGFLFLDGFGAVAPPPVTSATPEPASIAYTALAGFGLAVASVRKSRRNS